MKRPLFFLLAGAGLMLALAFSTPFPVSAVDTITLSPVSYTTTKGADGGQPVTTLAVMDQSGSQNNWDKYVEFQTPGSNKYQGYRTYMLPGSVAPSSVSAIQVRANFLGPAKSYQTWTWKVYNWDSGQWVTLGNNGSATEWRWSLLTFDAGSSLSSYIRSTGEIRIRIESNNTKDNSDLDYEALVVTVSGGAPTNTPVPTAAYTQTPSPTPVTATPTTPPPSPTTVPTTPPPGGSWWKPAPGVSWQWQLQGDIDMSVNVDMYDIDLFDVPQSVIDELKADGRIVICYFSAGSWENWRPDAAAFPDSVKGKNNGWPGEKWLDIRRIDILGPIMEARLDLAVQKGCDGVEPDNIDGYTNNTNFPLTYNDQIAYNEFLAQAAHDRNLSIGLKNDLDQVNDLVDDFDWALNEQCFQYNECDTLLPFVQAGKAVFGVEYQGSTSSFCPQANAMNFDWMKKKLALDAWREPCR